VLLADDDSYWRLLITRHLQKWGYDAQAVENGEKALEALRADSGVDVLVTDWLMPGMDGIALCEAARRLERPRYLFIIMLTAVSEKEGLLAGMNAGCDAFLSKPFDAPELLAHIRVAQRILALEDRIADQLEQLQRVHGKLKDDLAAAARIQEAMLPRRAVQVPGVEFAWTYLPTDEVGGDMCNFVRLDDTHAAMYILDVSGHGVQAALLSAAVSRVMTGQSDALGLLRRRSPSDGRPRIVPPAGVASELNLQFPMPPGTNQYFTVVYGVLDVPGRRLSAVRAGHLAPILVAPDRVEEMAVPTGVPVGFIDDADYEDAEFELRPGDKVLFYTDGVIEAFNGADEQYGIERLMDVLNENRSLPVEELLRRVEAGVSEFTEGAPRSDDLTMVAFGLV
jgi:sigma-B regulation protein RsbU (phosphoserine phosphatase)